MLTGITYPFRGFYFVFVRHPGLVRYWIWPLLLGIALALVVLIGAPLAVGRLESWIWPAADGAGWLAGVGHAALTFLLLLAMWAFGLVALFLSLSVLAAPFMDALSEAVERLRGGVASPPFSLSLIVRDAARAVRIELAKLCVYLALTLPLWGLSFFVPAIAPLTALVGGLLTCAFLGLDHLDWPASRRGLGLRARLRRFARAPWTVLSFGAGVWLLLFVPVIQLALLPGAVAGGTLLFLDVFDESSTATSSTGAPS